MKKSKDFKNVYIHPTVHWAQEQNIKDARNVGIVIGFMLGACTMAFVLSVVEWLWHAQ